VHYPHTISNFFFRFSFTFYIKAKQSALHIRNKLRLKLFQRPIFGDIFQDTSNGSLSLNVVLHIGSNFKQNCCSESIHGVYIATAKQYSR
jgi:hypothetical protein